MKQICVRPFTGTYLVTNSEGIAQVSFYTADTPGTYLVVIEGSNLDGGLGVSRGKLFVKQAISNGNVKK